ncbi:metal ABC transporter solute-binding protein, Zn/Mn family [Porphyromonas sp.]
MICSSFTRHLYIFLLAIGLLATSCKPSTQHPDRLQLTTTIAPAARVISEIADTLAAVTTLLPQGNSPENYEPTPQAIQALTTSTVYFYMGDLGFERSWVDRIHTMQPTLKLVRLDQGLADRMHHHNHPQTNTLHDPHYWTSVRGLKAMAHTIYTTLGDIDTLHREDYRAGYSRFSERLSRVGQEIQAQLTTLPSRAFVIYHPSLTEFAEEFGLHQLVVEQDGKEPTPQQIQGLIEEARRQGVRVVFIQQEFDSKLIQSIATELGARTVQINPLDGDWEGQLRAIAQALSDTSSTPLPR